MPIEINKINEVSCQLVVTAEDTQDSNSSFWSPNKIIIDMTQSEALTVSDNILSIFNKKGIE
jgi:hypothetical protein